MHFFSVKAFDSTCPEKGAIFEVPITVAKPETVQREIGYSKQYFAPGDIQRRFISVPKDATWAGECLFVWFILFFSFFFLMKYPYQFTLQFSPSALKIRMLKQIMPALLYTVCNLSRNLRVELVSSSTNLLTSLNMEVIP